VHALNLVSLHFLARLTIGLLAGTRSTSMHVNGAFRAVE
jgi:hypothetical protein